MKDLYKIMYLTIFSIGCFLACNDSSTISEDNSNITNEPDEIDNNESTIQSYKILSLGDSYTIGQSVFRLLYKNGLLNCVHSTNN